MSTTLAYQQYLEAVGAETARLTTVALDRLAETVPSCPEWTVHDLVDHLRHVYTFWHAQLLNGDTTARVELDDRSLPEGSDPSDALEEAAFLISLIADQHQKGWNADVRKVLARLAGTVLQATQDHVKALAIARTLGANTEVIDNDAFLQATWQVLQAERQCDALLRDARRVILGAVQDAPSLMLVNDLAAALELASDRLLTAEYALRDVVFDQAGMH